MPSDLTHGLIAGWLISLTPPCNEVVRLVSEEMDRPLPLRLKLKLRLHLWICHACERYRQQLLLIRTAMRQHPGKLMGQDPSTGLPPETRERLSQAFRRQQDK